MKRPKVSYSPVTRADVVDRVNRFIIERNNVRAGAARGGPVYLAPLLRYRAWQRAVCIARHNRLYPRNVLRAVAKHGVAILEVNA